MDHRYVLEYRLTSQLVLADLHLRRVATGIQINRVQLAEVESGV
jgi:hypothetical protein